MTHMEAMAALAQGLINIDAGLETIEKGSRVYRGMLAIAKEEAETIDVLREIERRMVAPSLREEALALVRRMIAERTDPEFSS